MPTISRISGEVCGIVSLDANVTNTYGVSLAVQNAGLSSLATPVRIRYAVPNFFFFNMRLSSKRTRTPASHAGKCRFESGQTLQFASFV